MNKYEAKRLISDKLTEYKKMDYQFLKELIDKDQITGTLIGINGEKYHYEIQFFWDNKVNGNIRVIGSIDDGGWRAYKPLNDDFIKDSNNLLIGE